MTYDLIQTFKQIFKDDKVVLDSYKMDAGYYYLAKKMELCNDWLLIGIMIVMIMSYINI